MQCHRYSPVSPAQALAARCGLCHGRTRKARSVCGCVLKQHEQQDSDGRKAETSAGFRGAGGGDHRARSVAPALSTTTSFHIDLPRLWTRAPLEYMFSPRYFGGKINATSTARDSSHYCKRPAQSLVLVSQQYVSGRCWQSLLRVDCVWVCGCLETCALLCDPGNRGHRAFLHETCASSHAHEQTNIHEDAQTRTLTHMHIIMEV